MKIVAAWFILNFIILALMLRAVPNRPHARGMLIAFAEWHASRRRRAVAVTNWERT